MSLISDEYLRKSFNFIENYQILEGTSSPHYNCISHTLNIKNKWSWPKSVDSDNYWPISNISETIDAFDEFYEYHGFTKTNMNKIYLGKNKIVLYSIGEIPKHAALQIKDDLYESKMGRGEIIRHDPFDIENSIYGNIVRLYEKIK